MRIECRRDEVMTGRETESLLVIVSPIHSDAVR